MSPIRQRRRLDDEVLLALLGGPSDGMPLLATLSGAGVEATAADLLTSLLGHEERGTVAIDRRDGYRFSLTAQGEEAARHVGKGSATPTTLVMADLVGFVSFTEREGDATAHDVAERLEQAARQRFARGGGRVVKVLGDGVLGTFDPAADALRSMQALAADCRDLGGSVWQLRGAIHCGEPIHHRGDVYGRDVNLVARLCELAAPGEALVTTTIGDAGAAVLDIRGIDTPIAVRREAL